MVHPLFKVHKLNADGFARAEELAQQFTSLAEWVEKNTPKGREQSIVLTHLQDASFHAKRAIAELPENQLPEQA